MMDDSALKPEARRRLMYPPWCWGSLEDVARLTALMWEFTPLGLWFAGMTHFFAPGTEREEF